MHILSRCVPGRTTGSSIALVIQNQTPAAGTMPAQRICCARATQTIPPTPSTMAGRTAGAGAFFRPDHRRAGRRGAMVLSALEAAGIRICTHLAQCAGVPDTPFAQDDPDALAAQCQALRDQPGLAVLDPEAGQRMTEAIRAAGADGDGGRRAGNGDPGAARRCRRALLTASRAFCPTWPLPCRR